MRTPHPVSAQIAVLLGAAALAGPAAAIPADVSHAEPHAGESTIQGSRHARPQQTPESAAPTPRATPQPIAQRTTLSAASRGLDWGSAGIGAAAGIWAFAIALAGAAGARRRRAP